MWGTYFRVGARHVEVMVKGIVYPQINNAYFSFISLFCSAIYQSRWFWCELPSFGDIGRTDFCFFSNIMGLNGALHVVLTMPQKYISKLIGNVFFQKS